ncbi:MAG: HEAT repeat domain-containing protein [Methanotrichaceae archaeon]
MLFFGKPNIKKLKDSKNTKELIKALDSKNLEIRIEAAKALGDVGGFGAIDPLKAVLLRDNDGATAYAAKALGKLKWKPTQIDSGKLKFRFWMEHLSDEDEAAKELASLGDSTLIDKSTLIIAIVLKLKASVNNYNLLAKALSQDGMYHRIDSNCSMLIAEYDTAQRTILGCMDTLRAIGDPTTIPMLEFITQQLENHHVGNHWRNLSEFSDSLPKLHAGFAIEDLRKRKGTSSLEASQFSSLIEIVMSPQQDKML